MVQRKKLKFHGWWGLSMAAIMLAAWVPELVRQTKDALYSADTFFEVRRVSVGNSVVGDPVILDVDRSILREFNGSYVVEVRKFPQRTAYCGGYGSTRYHPDATLPEPVTLKWWTFQGDCIGPNLPAGDYIIITYWKIDRGEYGLNDVVVSIESNPFTVAAVTPKEVTDAIRERKVIQERVQELEVQIERLREVD